ncbi:MAG TPA: YIP1 family protein [Acidobacteriaceae bacterium]|nr:YIP1 family protein [Acidobacteriaceae bacterium]
MPEAVIQPEASIAPLNEAQRIVDTFVAPSKLFADVRRSAAWWGPLLIMIIVSSCFAFMVQKKVGWAAVYDNGINAVPKVKRMIESLPPDQQAVARTKGIARQPYSAYAAPVLTTIFTAIFALLVWPTINFGFGGTAKYSKVFAVFMYGNLISYCARYLLAIIVLLIGVTPESFNFNNPVGTNLGFYLFGGDSPLWLVTLGTFLDVFGIWALVVCSIGCSITGRVKRGAAAGAVFGWWVLFMLVITGFVTLVS